MKPVVFGLSGLVMSDDERDFFRDCEPAGYIIFARNVDNRDQLLALTDSLRDLSGDDRLPILIDQEGGRVARMKPPHWPQYPAAGTFAALYDKAPMSALQAIRANATALALDLSEVGITVDCAPMLDVRAVGSSDVVGDRAFGSDPMIVAAMGQAMLDGLEAGGVAGIIKHMPGHGRAKVDSHKELPRVEASVQELERDLEPFRALSDATMGMTGHILFPVWDNDHPATLSADIIMNVIRQDIGFSGLLFTDDLDMQALSGTVPQRAIAAIEAGCDIALNCWAKMDDMIAIAELLPDICAESMGRLTRAKASFSARQDNLDQSHLIALRDELLAVA